MISLREETRERYGRQPRVLEPSQIHRKSLLSDLSRASPPNVIIALLLDRISRALFPRAGAYPTTTLSVPGRRDEDARLGIR